MDKKQLTAWRALAEATPKNGRVKLLRSFLDALPNERFDMTDYVSRGETGSTTLLSEGKDLLYDCGTAACVAGWVVLLAGLDQTAEGFEVRAGEWLGIDPRNTSLKEDLFRPDGWSGSRDYTRAGAVRMLDRYIKKGEVDWNRAQAKADKEAKV
jgi:hypothetical protein